jgi:membrane peptidoglycan carboxypeptidase
MFEPGSVFKIVTASAALESKVVHPSQQFNAEQGTYTVKLADGRIRVIRDSREYHVLTFQQAMEFSSNIVMAKVSDLIGADRLYTKARAFGFGSKTGVEYPGEVSGDLKRPAAWSGTTLNTLAYGYEVGVTPIQIISAYAAVANDGILMRPMLLSKIVTGTGEVIEERKPEQIRRVISPGVAATIKQFLEGVVQRGTGVAARMENIRIGGKTGTSRKYAGGQYQIGSYTASFVGFFPLEHPEIVCLVMLDNPDAGMYTGGAAAAPIFREIVEQIVATGRTIVPVHDNVIVKRNDHVSVPDVTGLQLDVARKILESMGLGIQTFGEGIVTKQSPRAGSLIERGMAVTLALNSGAHVVSADEVVVPNVRGMSLRRAVNRLAVDRLKAKVYGSGLVVNQMPDPGSAVSAGTAIVLVCQSRNVTERVLAEKTTTDE